MCNAQRLIIKKNLVKNTHLLTHTNTISWVQKQHLRLTAERLHTHYLIKQDKGASAFSLYVGTKSTESYKNKEGKVPCFTKNVLAQAAETKIPRAADCFPFKESNPESDLQVTCGQGGPERVQATLQAPLKW